MNILIVTPELPWPLEAGGRASQFATLRALQADHAFRIVLTREIENLHTLAAELERQLPHVEVIRGQTAAKPMAGRAGARALAASLWTLLRRLGRGRKHLPASPLPERPYYPFVPLPSGCMARIFSQRHWADLIQAEFHESLFTAFLPLGGMPKLFVCHQAHGLFCERFNPPLHSQAHDASPATTEPLLPWMRQADSQAARTLEASLLRRFDRVITFTAEDRDALLRGDSDLPVVVSPFPLPADIRPVPPREVKRWGKRLVFIGPGHWHPNMEAVSWFCREVRPLLLEHCSPSLCTLHVFGRWSLPLRDSLQGQGVEFHGFVPDPAPEIAGCIALNPVLTGAGLRTKVLLAAACSAALVSTREGCEGTGFRSGEHCLLAESSPAFAEAITQLLRSPELCRSLASRAFEALMHSFSPQAVRQRRNTIYRSLQGAVAP